MRISLALAASAAMLAHAPAHAQDSRGSAVYKVEFNIHDGNGAAAKIRRYTLVTTANQKATIRVGSRVPTATGSFQPGVGGVGVNPLVNTQYTYLDVGVDIECIVADVNGKMVMHGTIDSSSIVEHEGAHGAPPPNPTLGQTKVTLDTSVEPGKPTTVAAIDDPVTGRQFQVQATVTRVN
jgi:general secretion pathway protein D